MHLGPQNNRLSQSQDPQKYIYLLDITKDAMLSSIRTSWEQGTAAASILEYDYPEYSLFGNDPFAQSSSTNSFPVQVLQMALSTVVRQGPDGRLSQNIGDALDGASLDGASAGSVVLLASLVDSSAKRRDYFRQAADKQIAFISRMSRTSSGAISQRMEEIALWSDAMYMGPPFIAYYGAVTNDASLIKEAYVQCKLYREALVISGPTGPLWAHIFSESRKSFVDAGLWATGNAWAALGMLRVAITIIKSTIADDFLSETTDLITWICEILDGTFAALNSDNLIPNYISPDPPGAQFSDAAASAALASVAYRLAVFFPSACKEGYIETAEKIRVVVVDGIELNGLGLLNDIVNPVVPEEIGVLSTEAQAFALMMFSAWRDWKEGERK